MRAMVSIRLQTVEIIWWWRNLFSLSCMQDFSRKFNRNGCQCYCEKQIESLFSLGISNEPPCASYVYFLEPTFFFVFTERNSLCVCLYQTSKLYHKPGLTTLAFALICSQSFQECSNFVVNQIFNFTKKARKVLKFAHWQTA